MKTKLEDLRKWFGKGKKGDWVRVGTDGEIKGDCAREPGEGKPKCMPRSKAYSMDKKDRASSARRKRRADPSVDRPGTGNKPIMVKTDKKESVVHEDVNVKSIDKFKAAARDFDKNKDINFQSIADALLTIATAVRMLDKSTSGRTDYKNEKIISKESTRINNIVNKLNYGKGGATPEGKEIVKLLNKHGLNRPFHNLIFEGVEMNEQFVVKYAKNKRGPIYQTKFRTQPEAEKFLAQKRKEGMNGIVSKAGKPVSMQKMADLQKESVDEATMADRTVLRAVRIAKDMGGNMTGAVRRIEKMKKGLSDHPKVQAALRLANESLEEKNVPTNPALWAKFKAQAKAKFDVYPSAYANGWAAKKYKAAGGSWKTESVQESKSFWDIRDLNENYRTLARHGMGTETKNSINVGREIDYYDGAGTKRMGKVTKMGPKSYMVKDDKDGKVRQFTYHDRAKAKELLAKQ